MNIELSWDLFVLVFFVVIMAYSLIIGRDNTLKVILGTYVAALTADAAGNLFAMMELRSFMRQFYKPLFAVYGGIQEIEYCG